MALSDNSKYLPMFTSTGGDVIDPSAGTAIPSYVFVENGWRIKPQEADHTLNVTGGVLVVGGGGDPFTNTNGAFQIRINYSQPVQAIAVAGSGSAPDASTVADAVWTHSFVSKILTVAKFLGLRSS